MKSITDVFAKSVIDVLTNQEQIEARASIRLALTADSRLAIRTIQAIVESGQLTAAATPSPESFADLLLEFIDPVVINALIATPYEPTDIGSIAAMARLLSSVSEDKRTRLLSRVLSGLLVRVLSLSFPTFSPFSFFSYFFGFCTRSLSLFIPFFTTYRPAHRKGRVHGEQGLARRH